MRGSETTDRGVRLNKPLIYVPQHLILRACSFQHTNTRGATCAVPGGSVRGLSISCGARLAEMAIDRAAAAPFVLND